MSSQQFDQEAQQLSNAQGVSLHLARRALAVRKGDSQRAVELIKNYKVLDAKYNLSAVTFESVKAYLEKNERITIPFSAVSPKNLLVFNIKYHQTGEFTFDNEVRILSWLLDELSRRVPNNEAIGLVMIINLADASFSQIDTNLLAELLQLLQDHLPARIEDVLVCNSPWWVSMFFRFVLPFLKPKLAKKITLIASRSALLEIVPREALPTSFGGLLVYKHADWLKQHQESRVNKEEESSVPLVVDQPDHRVVEPTESIEDIDVAPSTVAPEVAETTQEIEKTEEENDTDPASNSQLDLPIENTRLRSITKTRPAGPGDRRRPSKKAASQSNVFLENENDAKEEEKKEDEATALAPENESEASFEEKKTKLAGKIKTRDAKVIKNVDQGLLSQLAMADQEPAEQSEKSKPVAGVKLFGDFDPSKVKLKKRGVLTSDLFANPKPDEETTS